MQRPTSVTVFGVLNLVFGIWGLLGAIIQGVALFAVDVQHDPDILFPMDNPIWKTWTTVSFGLSWVGVVLLIGSGIGLLRLRWWGRTLAIIYSIFAIITGMAAMGMSWFLVAQPALGHMSTMRDPEQLVFLGAAIGGLIGGCVWLIYPALLWYYMTRPHVVAALSGVLVAELETYESSLPPVAAADAKNPYASPQPTKMPGYAPPSSGSESAMETLIPSRNGPALLAYYLGLFSLFPCLGFPLGIVAVYYGVKGLQRVRENPEVRGGVHAWVGLVCGGLFGFLNFLLLAGALVAAIGSSLRH